MFSDLYKADNQMIVPSDELLAQISENMKSELEHPTKFFWIKSQSVQRLATMAAATVILTVAAVFLPIALDSSKLVTSENMAGSTLYDSAESENNQIRAFSFGETDGNTGNIENSTEAETAIEDNEKAAREITDGDAVEPPEGIIVIGEGGETKSNNDDTFDISIDGVSYDDTTGGGAGAVVVEEAEIEIIDDDTIVVDDDEMYDEVYEEEIAVPEDEVVEEDDYEETADSINMPYCDYNSYIEWAVASVWNELSVNGTTPPKTVVPEIFDVMDSTEIPNSKTDLKTLGEFAKEYLSVKHRILTLSCTDKNGTYPADYAVDNMAEFYAPVYSLLNNYLGDKMTYRHLNEVMPFSPYVLNNDYDDIIMFDMRTGNSVIYIYITSGDKLILQKNNSFAGEYELNLEAGTYNKLWNYINSSPYYILGIAEQE